MAELRRERTFIHAAVTYAVEALSHEESLEAKHPD